MTNHEGTWLGLAEDAARLVGMGPTGHYEWTVYERAAFAGVIDGTTVREVRVTLIGLAMVALLFHVAFERGGDQ